MIVAMIRAVFLYFLIVFSIRLMGKRQIGELQPSELVITILVSNIATLPLEDSSIPLIVGVVPILTLVCLEVIMSSATLKSRRLRCLMSGRTKVIVRNGEIDRNVLGELRFSLDDLYEALRSQGIFDIEDVETAIVETTGKVSVYQRFGARTPTNEDLGITGKNTSPPEVVICDGEIVREALGSLGLDAEWLTKRITREGLSVSEVFLMTVDADENINIIRKKTK